MEPVGRSSNMGSNTNTTAATATSVTSAVVGLSLTPDRSVVIANNLKTTEMVLSVPLQHCNSGSNVIHHQYSSIILPPPPAAMMLRSTQANILLPTSPQLMPSTAATTTSGVISHFQPHGNVSQQLATASTVPVSATLPIMPSSNMTSAGIALSPFGILPHERVVPHHTHHHRHQPRKMMSTSSSKMLMDPINSNNPQILTTPVIHSQRFYIEPPSHLSNKMKQYDSTQQQHNRNKNANSDLDKSLPVVSSAYSVPSSYEQRYQPRTPPQQVGYLSVITRTAVTTANSVMNDVAPSNISYYPTQPITSLQSKTSDNQDRPYYHFESTVSASQTPQQQLDNILLMGTPVQRGDPMHIVKNLQSMQSDINCYGVKKIIEQQPKLLTTDSCKTIGSTGLLNNSSKTMSDHQHQHLQQLPKSSLIDPSSTYNGEYFINRQPPPAHLHQHQNQPHLQQHIVGNTKMLPTPTSLSVLSANGNTPLDVQQYQRHLRWNLDQQKPPSVSTSSCFSGNISSGVFHQPSLQHQQFNNVPSTFNVQPSASSIHQNQQQLSQPAHHNNFNVSSISPTYYNPATTIVPTVVTTVATTNTSLSSYGRPQHNNQPQHSNNFQDFTNNLHGGNYVANENTKSSPSPHVIVPNIELELSHLCDSPTTTHTVAVKPFNTTNKKPSFLDSYIKFLHGGSSCTTVEKNLHDSPKKLSRPLSCSTPKPKSKPYIPLQKPKIVSENEHFTPTRTGSSEDNKKISNVTTTTDDDPRYFPLPKTSSLKAGISDDRSDGSNGGNSSMSADENEDQWWITSSKGSINSTSVYKNKVDKGIKINKNNGKSKKRSTNSTKANKKPKTQYNQQSRRQLSHRLAKDKSQKLLNDIDGVLDEDDDDLLSDPDSDIDPAWIPNNDDNDTTKNCNSVSNRRSFSHKKFSKEKCSKSEQLPSTSSSINNNNDRSADSNVALFKSGTFVVLKSQYLDSEQVIPQQLWRVDGKSMLQKFKRCNEDNVYKGESTFTGWNPSHYSMYRQVNVELVSTYNGVKIVQNKSSSDILVQLISDDGKPTKNNSIVNTEVGSSSSNPPSQSKSDFVSSINSADSVNDQYVMLRTKFDVYIQCLVSQVLDPNFLAEIYHEKDEYFLNNVRAIEKVTQNLVEAIDSAIIRDLVTDLSKVENIRTLIKRYPTMEMYTTDESSVHSIQMHCIVCGYQGFVDKQRKFVEISLSGTEYNNRTLKNAENNRPFSKIMPAKRVHCCSSTQCSEKVIILHSLEHLKYQLYQECCKRVTSENNSNNKLTQETTAVLNRLLADDDWIQNLFQFVCNTWNRAKGLVSNRQ